MKKYFLLLVIPVAAVFGSVIYFDRQDSKLFYERLNERIEISRERLERDGMNKSQIETVLGAIKQSAELTYWESRNSRNTWLFPLALMAIFSVYKMAVQDKELKELKEKIDV